MKTHLALIAPQIQEDKNEYKNVDKKVLPMGIYTLKSYLSEYFTNIVLIDAITNQYAEEQIVDMIERSKCNLVGISGITNKYFNSVISLAAKLRQLDCVDYIFVGGPIATFCYDILLEDENIDFVIRGEGELVLKNVITALCNDRPINDIPGICYQDSNGHIIVNPLEKRLNTFDLFKADKYNFTNEIIAEYISGSRSYVIMASRGCDGCCDFCQVPEYYGERGVKWRDPNDVVDEIEYAITHWGVRRINFQDSNFLCNYEWLLKFIDIVRSRNMNFKFNIFADAESVNYDMINKLKQIGLYQVFVGFETGSEARFNKLRKRATFKDNQLAYDILRSLEIKIIPGFILFYPDSNISEIIESVMWFKEKKLLKPSMYFNKMDVWYGTEMYKKIKSNGLLIETSITDGVKYKFEDKLVSKLYSYMMIGLEELKNFWRAITINNAERRKYLSDIILQEIKGISSISNYKKISSKVDALYEQGGIGFGRARNNELILNEIIDKYFFESIRCIKNDMCYESAKIHLRKFARGLIKHSSIDLECSNMDWKKSIGDVFV